MNAPVKRVFFAVAATAVLAAIAASTVPTAVFAQGKPDDALRAALEESRSSGKGLTFHIRGSTIGGAVTAMGDRFVTVKNQAGVAVVRIDSIDAVAGAITLK
jgi:hypothetical protein